jgi:outer membrane biosynthesis protein TonB
MKTPRKSVAWLLPLMLTGCFHKTEQAQNQPLAPPVVDTPPPAPAPSPNPKDLPPPVVTVPPAQPAQESTPPPKPPAQPAKHQAHNPKPQQPKQETKPETKTTEQASNKVPAVPAVGQLSAGDPADLRNQTEDSIASTERGLKDINRQLSDQEQKTIAQIREFLKQAKAALTTGDVDGAHTLALKAKVLLGEINQ